MKTQPETALQMHWEPEAIMSDTVGSTPRPLRLGLVLTLVAGLAFGAGAALGPGLQRASAGALANLEMAPNESPARLEPALTGALYDNGWAGGPASGYQNPVAWNACGACYDGGWAGGPGAGYQTPSKR